MSVCLCRYESSPLFALAVQCESTLSLTQMSETIALIFNMTVPNVNEIIRNPDRRACLAVMLNICIIASRYMSNYSGSGQVMRISQKKSTTARGKSVITDVLTVTISMEPQLLIGWQQETVDLKREVCRLQEELAESRAERQELEARCSALQERVRSGKGEVCSWCAPPVHSNLTPVFSFSFVSLSHPRLWYKWKRSRDTSRSRWEKDERERHDRLCSLTDCRTRWGLYFSSSCHLASGELLRLEGKIFWLWFIHVVQKMVTEKVITIHYILYFVLLILLTYLFYYH